MAERKPKDRPSSILHLSYLVTVSYGNRLHVVYHGNDRSRAEELVVGCAGKSGFSKRRAPRKVVKLWLLKEGRREPL